MSTINISTETLLSLIGGQNSLPADTVFEVGRAYLFRSVTYHQLGRIVKITPQEILIDDASWVADSGRFSEAIKTGVLNEVEPVPGHMVVMRGGLIDATPWEHELPREVK